MDKRKHYILILDTETVNGHADEKGKLDFSDVFAYDIGYCIVDTRGAVYLERSFVNSDIFFFEKNLMQSAYYANKIPQYEADLLNGTRLCANTAQIRKKMITDMQEYNITEVCAHNARFDIVALNNTQRYTTKSRFRYWFPYGTKVWDSMLMARSVIHKQPTYKKFIDEHNLRTASGKLPTSAEALYKFIEKNPVFVESHTGLEDVQIEREIVKYCYRQKKQMRKVLYE